MVAQLVFFLSQEDKSTFVLPEGHKKVLVRCQSSLQKFIFDLHSLSYFTVPLHSEFISFIFCRYGCQNILRDCFIINVSMQWLCISEKKICNFSSSLYRGILLNLWITSTCTNVFPFSIQSAGQIIAKFLQYVIRYILNEEFEGVSFFVVENINCHYQNCCK